MQLNNKTTHEIITISRIDFDGNSVVINYYNRSNGELIKTKRLFIDKNSLNLSENLNKQVNFYELIYNYLAKLDEFQNYELSDDEKNWKIPERPIRLIIPQDVINQSLIEQNDLNIIIQRELKENSNSEQKFIYHSNDGSISYFLKIDDDDAPIIQPYIDSGQIILEAL